MTQRELPASPGAAALMPGGPDDSEAAAAPHAGSAFNEALAERVALRMAGRDHLGSSYLTQSLQSDFEEMTRLAEQEVGEYTSLAPASGPANCMVVGRPDWIRSNIDGFTRLLTPLAERIAADGGGTPLGRVLREGTRSVVSVELGALLGFLSQKVLGQYDVLLPEEGMDAVYYMGGNILFLEKRMEFPPKEFRLWIALHELTHRAQFTGVPWMREYFLGLVEESIRLGEPSSAQLVEAVRRVIEELLSGRDPLAENSLMTLIATPEQRAVLDRVQALMCLLEGHGNVVMDRIGERLLSHASRMSDTLRARRVSGGLKRVIFRLTGLEMKVQQYVLGEKFVAAVEATAGPDAIAIAWTSPEALPTIEEIRDPGSWLARVA